MWEYESDDDVGEDLGDGEAEGNIDEEAAGELEGEGGAAGEKKEGGDKAAAAKKGGDDDDEKKDEKKKK